jgi:membrane protease YdiL (CAAX protease family)
VKLRSVRNTLLLAEPVVLYIGLIGVVYWAWTSPQPLWIRLAIVGAYNFLPLGIVKLHREQLTQRFGLRLNLSMISVVVVSSSVILLSYWYDKSTVWYYSIVLAPIGEEVFFRGYLLAGLSRYGRYVALVVSAFMFAAAHFLRTFGVSQLVMDFVAGILLGYIYLSFQSILVPILYHQTWNIVTSGFSPLFFDVPWNFVGILVYLAPISAVLVTLHRLYKTQRRDSACWICGRTESEIRRMFPDLGEALERYDVKGGTVNVCKICRQLLAREDTRVD